jgi:hypothetical protein
MTDIRDEDEAEMPAPTDASQVGASHDESQFASNMHEIPNVPAFVVAPDEPPVPPAPQHHIGPARHGAFARHKGTARETFSIAYNGMMVDFRAGSDIQADDGLFDAIKAARGPVHWR